jgi:tetrapyrrole methylase family protein / MazG family protein
MSGPKRKKHRYSFDQLLKLVQRLRGKGGCPWDREQNLDTLRQYLIEETYEVLDAIDSNDPAGHAEELGDLLLQILLQAEIRRENGDFTFADVADILASKLVRRHPHVFGDVKVSGSKDVVRNWEAIKSGEKKKRKSVLDGIPRSFPALHRAQKVQSRAARVGFDWARLSDVIAKVDEEMAETREAISRRKKSRIKEEIGDLLFSIVNLARFQNINAEDCMDAAISRFVRRFQRVEERVENEGRRVKDCTLAELDAHWEAVKKAE